MLLSTDAQTSPATNTASAARQVSCEQLLAAQERLKTRLLLSSVMDEGAMLVLALTETAEFISFQISKVNTSRWNPRKPNIGSYTPERRHGGGEPGPFENITIDKDRFTVNVAQI